LVKQYTSEDEIDLEVELMMFQLDSAFLAEGSNMTIEEFHLRNEEIELWAKLRYREVKNG
jgi:hypothetical protein